MSATIALMQHAAPSHSVSVSPDVLRVPTVRTANASLHSGAHGPSHHPHVMHTWLRFCGKMVSPVVRLGERGTRKALSLDHFEHQFVPTRLGKLHVATSAGQGTLPPVVVIHGLSASSGDYGLLLHRLRKTCSKVIAIDLPGHGQSDNFTKISEHNFIGAVTEALDRVITTPTVVFGHSLGGYVAMRYAAKRPNKVRALILAAPPGGPTTQAKRAEMVTLFQQGSGHDAVAVTVRAFPRSWPLWPMLTAAMQARMMRRSLRVLIHSDVQQMVLSKELLRTLKPPVLMLWADKERVVPSDHLTYFQKYLPVGSRFVKVRHMGHSEMAMGPKRMMRPLFQFVAHLPH